MHIINTIAEYVCVLGGVNVQPLTLCWTELQTDMRSSHHEHGCLWEHVHIQTDTRSTSKDSRGSTCTDARGRACTDIYTETAVMHRSTWLYISTEGMGVHGVTYTYYYTVNVAVQGRRNVYDRYGRYETKQNIGTNVVWKLRKGISYVDALHKGS